MKWVIPKDEFEKLSDDDKASDYFIVESSVEEITSKLFDKDDHYIDVDDKRLNDLEKVLGKAGYKIWSEFHENSLGKPLQKLKPKARRSYETFCGGFLYFYDHQLYSVEDNKESGYLLQLAADHNVNTQPVIDYFKKKLEENKDQLNHKMFFMWLKDKDHFPLKIFLKPGPGNPDPPSSPHPPPPETST